MSDDCPTETPFIITWQLKKFSHYVDSSFMSPFFNVVSPHFCCRLEFDLKRKDRCSCWLYRKNNVHAMLYRFLHINCRLKIICQDGNDLQIRGKDYSLSGGERIQWKDFIDFQEILKNKKRYLPGDCLTIQISMWGEILRTLNYKSIVVKTKVSEHTHSFRWNICNFSFDFPRECLLSLFGQDAYKLVLLVQEEAKVKILCQEIKQKEKKCLFCEIYLLNFAGFKKKLEVEGTYENSNHCYDFTLSLTKKQLINDYNTSIVNDRVCLFFEFSYSSNVYLHKVKYMFEESSTKDLNVNLPGNLLEKAIYDSYGNQELKDVVFEVGEKTIKADKFVLAARSPVFAAMFQHDMIEKRSGIVKIEGIAYETLEELLTFMYGGKISNFDYNKALELLHVAEKYQIYSLKEKCSMILRLNIWRDNVCEILAVADNVKDEVLKKFSIEFIEYHKKEVILSDSWKKLVDCNPKVAAEALTSIVLDKIEF